MISAPLPSLGLPRSFALPDLQIPGKDLSRWIPAKGGRSSSTIQEVPAAPSLPWVRKGTGDLGGIKKAKRNLSGLEGASHTPEQAGKGKCRQGGHGGGDGSSWDTRGEGEENSNREQRGQAGVGGRLISASSSKKKIAKHPQNPPQTPSTPPSTSQWEMGRRPRPQCFLFKTSKNISAL